LPTTLSDQRGLLGSRTRSTPPEEICIYRGKCSRILMRGSAISSLSLSSLGWKKIIKKKNATRAQKTLLQLCPAYATIDLC
jgi:hypothetical protein